MSVPGLFPAVMALETCAERSELERLLRTVDVYPLEGGRVRVTPGPGGGFLHAVVAEGDRPERDLPYAEAVQFSWRRDDSGSCERVEAGFLKVWHHGHPIDLIYTSPPSMRASLRVYPRGRPVISPRMRESEIVNWVLAAALWFLVWGPALAWHLTARVPSRSGRPSASRRPTS